MTPIRISWDRPLPLDAVAAMLEGLSRRYPTSSLLGGIAGSMTVELGDPDHSDPDDDARWDELLVVVATQRALAMENGREGEAAAFAWMLAWMVNRDTE